MRVQPIFLIALLIGCLTGEDESPDWMANVASNTDWRGSFGDRIIDSSGTADIDLPDDNVVCVFAQKLTDTGRLKVTIINRRNNEHVQSIETTEPFGYVNVCGGK